MSRRILIHTCCAPCLCYPAKYLKEKNFELSFFWYNPNIHGWREYNKRMMTLGYYLAKNGPADIIEGTYDIKRWFEEASSKEKNERCRLCYRMRLKKTAQTAALSGVDIFTTTLLYSKFQYFDYVVEEGRKAADEAGIDFYAEDFRQGWKEGITLSKNDNLYRQEYCGCVYSEHERYS